MSKEEKQKNSIIITLSKEGQNKELYLSNSDAFVKITNGTIYPPVDSNSSFSDVVGNCIVRPHTSTINDFVDTIRKNSGDTSKIDINHKGMYSGGYFEINKVFSILPEGKPAQKKILFNFHRKSSFKIEQAHHQAVNIDVLDIHFKDSQKVINNMIDGESLSYGPIRNAWINYVQGLKFAKDRIPCDISLTPDSLIVVNNCKRVSINPQDNPREKPIYTEGGLKLSLEMTRNGMVLVENYQSTIRLYHRQK